jgi:hypothetical protein
VDELQENVFSPKVKIRWINQLEAEVQTEALLLASDGVVQYTVEDMDAELIAPPPHDQIYQQYLFWQIALAQEEAERANNAAAMFDRVWVAYMRFVAMTANPGTGEAETLRYYLSAYQLAVKHGYTGTEEEWVNSLKGPAGEQGTPGAGLQIVGQVQTEQNLPKDGVAVGTGYLVGQGQDALLYIWDGVEWFYKQSLRGPAGRGEKGDKGDPGVLEVYEQPDEPKDALPGAIWFDTDDDEDMDAIGLKDRATGTAYRLYVANGSLTME